MVAVSINKTKAERKLRLLEAELRKEGNASLGKIGLMGKLFAQSKVPYKTGVVFRNIHYRTNNKEQMVTIHAIDPFGKSVSGIAPTRYPGRGYRKFHLIRYMHTNPSQFHSGDAQFMFTTRRYVARIAPGEVTGSVGKVIARINSM